MFSSLNVTPAELWQMLLTHLWLSGLALLAAVAIAVPAAVLFARRQRAAEAVLQFTNILQTIPSLALLGLLIPFVGIGSPPVLIALTLYALLPIFQNTYLGLTQIDQSIQDAYTAFGLSRWQSLWRIELPMALPDIYRRIALRVTGCRRKRHYRAVAEIAAQAADYSCIGGGLRCTRSVADFIYACHAKRGDCRQNGQRAGYSD